MDNEITTPTPIPEEQNFSFRKSLGGFNKSDVINFISEENKKFSEERSALQTKLDEETAKAAESEKKTSELQLYYELLLKKKSDDLAQKEKDAEEAAKKAEEALANEGALKAEAEELRKAAEESAARADEYEKVIAELRAKCEAYESELESSKRELEAKAAKCEELSAKCTELTEELSAKENEIKEAADKSAAAFVPVEEKAEIAESVDEASPVTARESASWHSDRPVQDSGAETQKEDTETVAEKAIDTIKSINEDVKDYMKGCVGEFDSCSKDITTSISKLLDEIAERCRMLDERIRAERSSVAKKIDDKYGDFKNK
jgi:chromosome segregation ATPase